MLVRFLFFFSNVKPMRKAAKRRAPQKTRIVTRQTVEHAARIARLELTEQEIKQFEKDLNSILDAFRDLDKADVKGVEPSFHPLPVTDVLRDDVPETCFTQEQALGNTAHKERGFFKGPRAV